MKMKLFFSAITVWALACACGPESTPTALTGRLQGLRLGVPAQFENLTAIPIYSDRPESRMEYASLEEALANKWLEIKETGAGTVPQVTLNNLSDKRIFILSGQIITGGKQDRIVSGDRIILPGQKDIDLDVFCVEAGRWTGETMSFYSVENIGTGNLREKAQRKTGSEQGEIWDEVAKVNAAAQVESKTSAYQDVYDAEKTKAAIARFEAGLKTTVDNEAVGVVIGIGGKVKSVDVFDNPAMFRRYWPLILKSSALAAVTVKEQGALPAAEAWKFLDEASGKALKKDDPEDRFRGAFYLDQKINASALETDEGLVHYSVFPVEKNAETRDDVNLDFNPQEQRQLNAPNQEQLRSR